jgi:hypothetical protein
MLNVGHALILYALLVNCTLVLGAAISFLTRNPLEGLGFLWPVLTLSSVGAAVIGTILCVIGYSFKPGRRVFIWVPLGILTVLVATFLARSTY